ALPISFDIDGDFLGQVTVGDGGRDLRDVAELDGEVGDQAVDVVGEVLPRARDAAHVGLAAHAPLGADLLGHACHFGGEGGQLIDHHVDGVLDLEKQRLAFI